MLAFGLIGTGNFGSAIQSKITNLGNLLWQANSESDYTQFEDPDWVFIASPNIFHYEQAKFFLKKGVNVFLEKPAVLNSDALVELIKISKKNNSKLYISDIFLFREDIVSDVNLTDLNVFRWYKSSNADVASIFDRLTYHHLYLIYHVLGVDDPGFSIIDVNLVDNYQVELHIKVEDCKFNLEYKIEDDAPLEHLIFGKQVKNNPSDIDALWLMLNYVINNDFDIEINHKCALWATTTIEKLKEKTFSNVNIIGGGIFGCATAIELANRGYNVELFEQKDEIFGEASSINQYRIHRGFHYPRSVTTSIECKKSASEFTKNFRQAILPKNIDHYYAISSEDSLTSSDEYINFLEKIGLEYEVVKNIPNTSLTVKVIEDLYDPDALKRIVKNRLFGSGVKVRLNHKALPSEINDKDFTVVATYSNLNDWLNTPELTQYELCEKPVFKMPDVYSNKSIVIMDGPFMCIDPLGDSGNHVMGNVVHAIHSSNIGFQPYIPKGFEELLNKGIIKNPGITNIDLFIDSAKTFFPEIENAEYIGSMYTFRSVKPDREHDDARPTIVNLINPKLATVFSGKICTCFNAAKKIASLVQEADAN